MTPLEKRAAYGLASIYGFRMLGLFLILPVFVLYAEHLPEATPLLIGLAVGIYGLTQAALQIPFGMLSDRIGRKPVIIGGLLLFAAGSVLAALADDIWTIIAGRALQGSGAIAAAVMALAADLTRESQRTKAMALIGVTIGLSFMVALVAGPMLGHWVGVSGIFWLTAGLALIGLAMLVLVVPTPVTSGLHRDAEAVPATLKRVLGNGQLLRLDLGIFCLHLILTALFLSVPLVLRDLGLATDQHSWLYLGVMLVAILAMVPLVVIAEKRGQMKPVFVGSVALLGGALGLLYLGAHLLWLFVLALTLFFTAFNLLESTLPSIVSKVAPPDMKGSAMGVYSTSQFLGAFVGGMSGGWIQQHFGVTEVFLLAGGIVLVWLAAAATMAPPVRYSNRLMGVSVASEAEAQQLAVELLAIPGIMEAVVVAEEGVAYLKVDSRLLDEQQLQSFAVAD